MSNFIKWLNELGQFAYHSVLHHTSQSAVAGQTQLSFGSALDQSSR
jgi:hypothetical protein